MQSNTFWNIKKILIIRLSSIGDIVLTSEIIRLVKTRYADSELHYLISSKFSDIIKHNPYIDKIIEYDKSLSMKQILKQRDQQLHDGGFSSYDLVIDLHNNFRSLHFYNGVVNKLVKIKKWRLVKLQLVKLKKLDKSIPQVPSNYLNSLAEFDIKSDGNGLEYWLDGETEYNHSLKNFKENPIIGLAPGAQHFTKRFPTQKLIEALLKIKEKLNPKEIKVFGSSNDSSEAKILSEVININDFTGKLSLTETASEINKCGLFITNDTGLMHIASARKVPIVAIFGSSVTNFGFSPYGTVFRIIENQGLGCRPCSHIGKSTCPKKHFKCMEDLDTNLIVEKAIELANQ